MVVPVAKRRKYDLIQRQSGPPGAERQSDWMSAGGKR
jgi:hypothetical protein